MTINNILRDGKELNKSQLSQARQLEELGLSDLEKQEYVRCVHPEDPDYNAADEDCSGIIEIDESEEPAQCPECGRPVFVDEKETFESWFLHIDRSGVRDYVRQTLKSTELVDRARTISDGRKYGGTRIEPVLKCETTDTEVLVHILLDNFERDIVDWFCVYDETALFILADNALHLRGRFDENDLFATTIGELVQDNESEEIVELVDAVCNAEPDLRWDRRSELSSRLCEHQDSLESMGWRDFEHCVHNLLSYCIGTSKMLGGTEPGTGVPDGAFSLHWGGEDALFMWDAKFIDLAENNETTISDEYDKIFRHLTQLNQKVQSDADFEKVSGIVLFSPGIEETNIPRLAEHIHEQSIPNAHGWEGAVSYFELDSLLQLFQYCKENRSNVREKPDTFRSGLHNFLTEPANHGDDEPEVIATSPSKSFHISQRDIDELFDYLQSQDPERNEFNKESYMRFLEFNFSLDS